MADFNIAYAITMKHEGGIANHPTDRGKLTYMGITTAFFPSWKGWPIVRASLTKTGNNIATADKILAADKSLQELVKQFYKREFWDVYSLDLVNDQSIANEIFDTAVNMGVPVEARFLQRALNITNKNQRLYPDLKVDGNVGPVTIRTLNAHPNKKRVLQLLNILQGARYISICENDPTQEIFVDSWFSRVAV